MSQSLAPQCTPLKHAYDSCFNTWFTGYLQPSLANGSGGNGSAGETKASGTLSQEKAKEYEQKCGKVWEEYRTCVQKAVREKGLNDLLDRAKEENPLHDIESVNEDK